MLRVLFLMSMLLSLGCGDADDFGAECFEGARYPCEGPGGCSGFRECLSPDPVMWSACVCGSQEDGGEDGGVWDGENDAGLDDGTAEARDDASDPPEDVPSDLPDPCLYVNCDDGDDCTDDFCDRGRCLHPVKGDGATCSDGVYGRGAGYCYAGECCDGCWTGSVCLDGFDVLSCGGGGARCSNCDDGNVCTEDACFSGFACQNVPVDATPCPDGVCTGGRCVSCGGSHEACCPPSNSCDPGFSCERVSSGSTTWYCSCGRLSEPCCDGTYCGTGTCNSEGYCR